MYFSKVSRETVMFETTFDVINVFSEPVSQTSGGPHNALLNHKYIGGDRPHGWNYNK